MTVMLRRAISECPRAQPAGQGSTPHKRSDRPGHGEMVQSGKKASASCNWQTEAMRSCMPVSSSATVLVPCPPAQRWKSALVPVQKGRR